MSVNVDNPDAKHVSSVGQLVLRRDILLGTLFLKVWLLNPPSRSLGTKA